MSLEINLIILGFLVLLSGFFSSVELAIFSIGRLKLKRLVSSNVRNAKILSELKSNPQRLLITILIGMTEKKEHAMLSGYMDQQNFIMQY